MFKISQLALAALSSTQVLGAGDQVLAQCQAITTSSGSLFNIVPLDSNSDYSSVVTGELTQTLHWTYCGFATLPAGSTETPKAYAYIVDTDTTKDDLFDVATNKLANAANIRDDDNKSIGLTFDQSSATKCFAADGTLSSYSMKTNLMCDSNITGDAQIESVVKDGCSYVVTMKTNEGCADVPIDLDAYMGWLYENEWAIGVIYIVVGPLIGLQGMAWFPYATASVIAIATIAVACYVGLAAGWMTSTGGCLAVCGVALCLGIVMGCLIRRQIWLMVSLLGAVAGFFLGAFVFAVIFAITGWNAIWGFWVIGVSFAGLGFLLSCYTGKNMVLLSTSLIGAYLFMRSWTMFFPGHYPSESELIDDTLANELEVDSIFWIFVCVFFTSFMGFACFQKARGEEHEDLYDYKRSD